MFLFDNPEDTVENDGSVEYDLEVVSNDVGESFGETTGVKFLNCIHELFYKNMPSKVSETAVSKELILLQKNYMLDLIVWLSEAVAIWAVFPDSHHHVTCPCCVSLCEIIPVHLQPLIDVALPCYFEKRVHHIAILELYTNFLALDEFNQCRIEAIEIARKIIQRDLKENSDLELAVNSSYDMFVPIKKVKAIVSNDIAPTDIAPTDIVPTEKTVETVESDNPKPDENGISHIDESLITSNPTKLDEPVHKFGFLKFFFRELDGNIAEVVGGNVAEVVGGSGRHRFPVQSFSIIYPSYKHTVRIYFEAVCDSSYKGIDRYAHLTYTNQKMMVYYTVSIQRCEHARVKTCQQKLKTVRWPFTNIIRNPPST